MHTILITGAASGIGAGMALELAAAGHHIVASDVRREDTDEVTARIRGAGGSVEVVALDVTSDASVAAAIAAVTRPIDVLVNNAGLQQVARLEEFPMGRWDLLIQVMLTGVARLTRAVLPGMRARGFGRIVNIRWSRARTRAPTLRPSTAWSAFRRSSRSRRRTPTSPSTPSVRAT
jgi:3-hydroxybutyrate dehydrogenase